MPRQAIANEGLVMLLHPATCWESRLHLNRSRRTCLS